MRVGGSVINGGQNGGGVNGNIRGPGPVQKVMNKSELVRNGVLGEKKYKIGDKDKDNKDQTLQQNK